MTRFIYFSATGTTKRTIEALGATKENSTDITLTTPSADELKFAPSDLIYLAFPVYGGRVPAIVLDRLKALNGNGCKAIIVSVYGNRHYDDAPHEMQAFAESHGCEIVASITAVAEHSIVPSIASGRPDSNDISTLQSIQKEIEERWKKGELKPFCKRPQETYKPYGGLPLHPSGSRKCTQCGNCAKNCPTGAIDPSHPRKTDKDRCITCMRCVNVCPQQARKLPLLLSFIAGQKLKKSCKERREIELILG